MSVKLYSRQCDCSCTMTAGDGSTRQVMEVFDGAFDFFFILLVHFASKKNNKKITQQCSNVSKLICQWYVEV